MQIARFAAIFTLIVFLALSAAAQTTTSRIEGVVQDSSGGVIPGAKITALNTKTGVSTETTTSTAGLFIFAVLQPGTYNVTAEASGFKKEIHTNVILNVSETISEAFKLEVGALTESVTVEADVQRINSSDAQVGRNITLRDIDVLPQLGRGPITLAVFMPGTQVAPDDTSFTVVNGLRQGSNNATLDGIDVNDAVVPAWACR